MQETQSSGGVSLSPLASLLLKLQQQKQQKQQMSAEDSAGAAAANDAAATASAAAAAAAEGALDMEVLLPDAAAGKGFVGVYRQLARSAFVALSPSLSLLQCLSPYLQLRSSSSSSSGSSSSAALLAAALFKVSAFAAAHRLSLGAVADLQQLIVFGLAANPKEV